MDQGSYFRVVRGVSLPIPKVAFALEDAHRHPLLVDAVDVSIPLVLPPGEMARQVAFEPFGHEPLLGIGPRLDYLALDLAYTLDTWRVMGPLVRLQVAQGG